MTIRSFFRPHLKTIDTAGQIGGGDKTPALMPTLYILARSRCAFNRVKLPAANRNGLQAVKMQAARTQRFDTARIRIEQDGPRDINAGIWSWDGAMAVDDGDPATSITISDLRILPETLARKPLTDGVRLVRCIDGYEGEVWQGGSLMASRWWTEVPNPRDWMLFLRAAKYAEAQTDTTLPAPEDVGWRDDLPVIDRDLDNLALMFSPVRVAAIAFALLAFLTAFQIGQQINHSARIATINERLETVTRDNRTAYQARANALTSVGAVDEKSSISDPMHILKVVTALTSEVTISIGRLINISLVDDGFEARFRFIDTPDIPALAANLEQNPYLAEIFIEQQSSDILVVKGKMIAVAIDEDTPLTEPQPLSEQTDPAS